MRTRTTAATSPLGHRSHGVAMALVLVASTCLVALLAPPQVSPAGAIGGSWTVYHGDVGGSGVASGPNTFTSAAQVWQTKKLKGQIYGEPLVADGLVVVATESNWVYGLSESSGAIVWKRHVAPAVSARSLPCGNIAPTVGITSTPVIDTTRSEVFVVADEHRGRTVSHHLVGLSLLTGAVVHDEAVDPPGSTPKAQLQRAALTLDSGNVVIGSGGNAGDCSTYHGWVVSVPEGGGPLATFEVDPSPGNLEGAVWMGGAAPVIDPSGNIWVATGNGSNDTVSPDYSDSVVELSPVAVGGHLPVLQTFTPTGWASDNDTDADLGSSAPAVLPNGVVVQAGKSQTAYLLDQSALGGVGGQTTELDSFCGADVDGGIAYQGSVVYLPCLNGVIALQVQTTPTPSLTQLWSDASGSAGPAIVANGLVWSIDQGGNVWGMSPADGSTVVQLSIGSVANHFPTPSVTDGMLFAAGTNTVFAFRLTP